MDDSVQNKEMVPENFRKQLGVAVRSVQWSYAIFWSPSTSEQGTLEWANGYYNGDIKTRKRDPSMELKADAIGLERSEQLRELYKSLLGGEIDQQNKRRSAALSPEDLSDAEWYYLVCMSFVFKADEGLPGRALANKQTIWLCNAQYADSKVFTRSLLAKSASIQTVICFPHFKGVIELGATELVSEDHSLIQHIKASLLDFSKPHCSEKFSTAPHNAEDDDHDDPIVWKDQHVNVLGSKNLCIRKGDFKFQEEGVKVPHENTDEERSKGSSDEYSNGCKHSQRNGDSFLLEGVDGEDSQVQDWDLMVDEVSHGVQDAVNYSNSISDTFLNPEKTGKDSPVILESCKMRKGLNLSDHQRENAKLLLLSSMLPSICKTDKVAILTDTIKCLMELETRIEELESCMGLLDYEVEARRSYMDLVDQTSYNYENKKLDNGEKHLINKKTNDIDEGQRSELSWVVHKDGMPLNLKVSRNEKEVIIDMRCPSREYILVDIVDAINSLKLEIHSIQSSTLDGILTLALISKFRGAAVAPAVMIKEALWRVADNS